MQCRHGYWLGNIDTDNMLEDTLNDTAPCQYPYCKTDLPPCPIIGLSQTYNQLTVTLGEQCNGLYGGVLCRSCREDAVLVLKLLNVFHALYRHWYHAAIKSCITKL